MEPENVAVQNPPRRGRPPKPKVNDPAEPKVKAEPEPNLKISDMPNPPITNDGRDEQIDELKKALEPFAKMPYEQDEKEDKVLYRLTRGKASVEITNGDIIRAKKLLNLI